MLQRVQYKVNMKTKQCYRQPLNKTFIPIGVPDNVTFDDTRKIGSSTAPGAGVQVDVWAGLNTGEAAAVVKSQSCY